MARYRIVPEQSSVWIDARSSVHPIHSRTDGLEGTLDLELDAEGRVDLGTKPSGTLSLPVDRLSSGNRMEDRELHKRIDARKFPRIEGVLDHMETGGGDGSYVVRGDITFRGVTRPHEGEITIGAAGDRRVALAGSSRFDVRQFGMQPPRILMLKVEPIVEVRVEILAEREA